MIISVGDFQAMCSGAAAPRSIPNRASELRPQSELTCSGCGRKTTYHDLLEQIGERAMQQANESLAKLRGSKDE
jgi:uncharacterized Zn-finger protein